MQRLFAITWLTLKAAVRFRLVIVLSVVLLAGVVLLPLVLKDDGTARGFTQILLTYTLSMITALLGFSTLWLACGTLARDVEEAQIQMVAVKPISRWQIWMGKWLGILVLNGFLLVLSGAAVYFLLQWRAQNLPEAQQRILQNEILVARGSIKPKVTDYRGQADQILRSRLQTQPLPEGADLDYVRRQILEQLRAQDQVVPPGYRRPWELEAGFTGQLPRDRPLFLRFRFNTAEIDAGGTYMGALVVGDFESPQAYRTAEMSLAADTFHEIPIPPTAFDGSGRLVVNFINRSDSLLLFPLEDGIEILYREGGFGLNFVRGIGIIFLWLSLLGAIGLAASSFLSFPVAAFVSVGVLIVGLSTGTIAQIIEQGTVGPVNHDTGVADQPMLIDYVALPIFKTTLSVLNLVRGFSPVDSLSSGRSISWGQMARAFFQIGVLMSGLVCVIGIVIFNRRELATAQGTQG
jgi:hypothetical protein